MDKLWIKEWNIGRVCIAIANEWLWGYERDAFGRNWYLGFFSVSIFDDDEEI